MKQIKESARKCHNNKGWLREGRGRQLKLIPAKIILDSIRNLCEFPVHLFHKLHTVLDAGVSNFQFTISANYHDNYSLFICLPKLIPICDKYM